MEKTISQLQRMLGKVAAKFPATDEPSVMTDIHIRINQETGDVMVFDDDAAEITRVVVEDWIGNNDEVADFYGNAAKELRRLLMQQGTDGVELGMTLGLLMPYNFVLEDELGEAIEELYIADIDQDTIVVGEPFMVGLSDELDTFIKELLDE